jgi:hypothetical protein
MGLIPFVLHSGLFAWKSIRYAMYLLPWLVMPVAVLAAAVARRIASWPLGRGVAAAVAILAFLTVTRPPWIWHARHAVAEFPAPPWRQSYAWLEPQLTEGDVILTSMPLATRYYADRRADYVINNNAHWKRKINDPVNLGPEGLYVDHYAGLPMVMDVEDLRVVMNRHPTGWILIDDDRYVATWPRERFMNANLRNYEIPGTEMAEYPVHVYRWNTEKKNAYIASSREL